MALGTSKPKSKSKSSSSSGSKSKSHSHSSSSKRTPIGAPSRVAADMIAIVSDTHPISSSSRILDNACGPGIVTAAIKSRHSSARIIATDITPVMIDQVDARIKKEGWKDVRAGVMDMRDMRSFSSSEFTHIFANFGVQVLGSEESVSRACREMFRVLRPGGVCAMSGWVDYGFNPAYAAAARAVRPKEEPRVMVLPSTWYRGSWIMRHMEDAGFSSNLSVELVDTWQEAANLDVLTDMAMIPASSYFPFYSSEELRRARSVLKEELQELDGFEEDEESGAVRILMTAWIAKGMK